MQCLVLKKFKVTHIGRESEKYPICALMENLEAIILSSLVIGRKTKLKKTENMLFYKSFIINYKLFYNFLWGFLGGWFWTGVVGKVVVSNKRNKRGLEMPNESI